MTGYQQAILYLCGSYNGDRFVVRNIDGIPQNHAIWGKWWEILNSSKKPEALGLRQFFDHFIKVVNIAQELFTTFVDCVY